MMDRTRLHIETKGYWLNHIMTCQLRHGEQQHLLLYLYMKRLTKLILRGRDPDNDARVGFGNISFSFVLAVDDFKLFFRASVQQLINGALFCDFTLVLASGSTLSAVPRIHTYIMYFLEQAMESLRVHLRARTRNNTTS